LYSSNSMIVDHFYLKYYIIAISAITLLIKI